MRIIVVGLNEQGLLRQSIAGLDCVALTRTIQEIPLDSYDATLICADNENKYTIASFALVNKKHVLLEAPAWGTSLGQLDELGQLSRANNVVLYIAYSFRFVVDFINMQQILNHKQIGEIHHCRIAYAANAENKHNGALIDLSPHLLDLLSFWFGSEIMQNNFSIMHKDKFDRQIIFADFNSRFTIEIEANFLARSNVITAEFYGTRDHLQLRYEYTDIERNVLAKLEYAHFQVLCQQIHPFTDCVMHKWIYAEIDGLASEEMLLA